MQRKSNQVNVFEVKIVIDVVEHLLWDKIKATCDLILFLLCIFLFSMFLKFGWSRKRKTKKVVAQHIPFWVECMFLVETLYCSDYWSSHSTTQHAYDAWNFFESIVFKYGHLPHSCRQAVLLVAQVWFCHSWGKKRKREWRKEKNERKKTG